MKPWQQRKTQRVQLCLKWRCPFSPSTSHKSETKRDDEIRVEKASSIANRESREEVSFHKWLKSSESELFKYRKLMFDFFLSAITARFTFEESLWIAQQVFIAKFMLKREKERIKNNIKKVQSVCNKPNSFQHTFVHVVVCCFRAPFVVFSLSPSR